MDTVTHVLLGAVCTVAVSRSVFHSDKALRTRLAVTGAAAAFPDIDYLSFWIDPLLFLADWHRTWTHSLLLMPLWAGLIWAISMSWYSARRQPAIIFALCCLGIFSHICLDLLTVYGVRVLYPLSDMQFNIGIVFVIDGLVTSILVATLFLALHRSWRQAALSGLLLLTVYFGSLWTLKNEAQSIAGRQLPEAYELQALPQPFSPFYWQLIGQSGADYRVAYLNLLSEGEALINAYRGSRSLDWTEHRLLGSHARRSSLIAEVWTEPQFIKFREFARYPVLYRLDQGKREVCVWFTDLRYVLPYLTPSFRYGMCGTPETGWGLYRLKRFTENERHRLHSSVGWSPE